ncbi:hypothetical protein DCD74_02130 [Lysobacter oculi]|uniref:Uncharacterized protein n=2 Tax=Solilutibacter oculi TaxID=2698682 RepID=A0A344J3N7_9GAMM|nr:hypothetical protein DCD74_02130 [Lysobacter oculi]
MQFGHISLYKTYYFLEMFLRGYEEKNPYELIFSSRALIEVYTVVRDTFSIVHANAGEDGNDFLNRVIRIDEALINATYGSRSEAFKKSLPMVAPSRRPPAFSSGAI